MSSKDIASYLNELSEKMDRYEQHRLELKKDVKAISDRQSEMVVLLAGSELNGKRGVLNLMDEIDKRTRMLEVENKLIQKDIEMTKFWGTTAVGLFVAIILIAFNTLKDKING